uniref:Uncharacterized protein n=1 Tax=Cacopsylla melanoneura TaxID=428564 RepID=A0A8D9EAR4_9HEMI
MLIYIMACKKVFLIKGQKEFHCEARELRSLATCFVITSSSASIHLTLGENDQHSCHLMFDRENGNTRSFIDPEFPDTERIRRAKIKRLPNRSGNEHFLSSWQEIKPAPLIPEDLTTVLYNEDKT